MRLVIYIENCTHVREIVIVDFGTALRHAHGPFVGGTDKVMICNGLAHLLLVHVAVVARLPSGVLQMHSRDEHFLFRSHQIASAAEIQFTSSQFTYLEDDGLSLGIGDFGKDGVHDFQELFA